jgi:phosphohistidine phosphatase
VRTLFILRHAKSSWDDASLADIDRPLNGRGLRDAPKMGELMRNRGFVPDMILSSPAKRAAETVKLVKDAGGFDAEITLDERIYEASPNTLRRVAADINEACSSALLVGHNPGIEGFIRYLTGRAESMPTAALAVIDLDISEWRAVSEECGALRHVFRPKELTSL